MPSLTLFRVISSLIFICLISCRQAVAAEFLGSNCLTNTNTTSSSMFRSNLYDLLSRSASTPTSYGFYNTSVGQEPDKVYGLYLCRGYILVDGCYGCVASAARDILRLCRNSSEAFVYYDYCMLRYSDRMFFGVLETEPVFTIYDKNNNNSEPGLPDVDAKYLIESLKRSVGQTPLMFQKGKIAWCIYFASCNARYGESVFWEVQNQLPAPVPQPLSQPNQGRKGRKKRSLKIIMVTIASILGVSLILSVICSRRRTDVLAKKKGMNASIQVAQVDVLCLDMDTGFWHNGFPTEESGKPDLPIIPLSIIIQTTNDFSDACKLGEGGFGPVYKGTVPDGKQIAVKRLSKVSSQGLEEFKNDVILIAKLRHRNLVRLSCCCIEENEKLLVYEYMTFGSLNVHLFDVAMSERLDWQLRLNIANGIAKGLMYLHEDSRLRIIHRDLKASNILLDHEMSPKISAFGMARIFGGGQGQANTNRIVGTYGYMAPEYAMKGIFSVKSDVFSFGVLLLEIIAGKRNGGFYLSEHGQSLLSYAWKLWHEGKALKLMDSFLENSCVISDVLKCVHIALLCVQEDATDRPTMPSVVLMLASDKLTLPAPNQPGFSVGRLVTNQSPVSAGSEYCSVNEITLSSVCLGSICLLCSISCN